MICVNEFDAFLVSLIFSLMILYFDVLSDVNSNHTRFIDLIIRKGASLTDDNITSPQCSPSRAGLLCI